MPPYEKTAKIDDLTVDDKLKDEGGISQSKPSMKDLNALVKDVP